MPTLRVHFRPEGAPSDACLLVTSYEDMALLEGGLSELPALSADRAARFRAAYDDAMCRLNQRGQDAPLWWYTPLATCNIWTSQFYLALYHLFRLDQALDGRSVDLHVICRSAPAADLAVRMAIARGWHVAAEGVPCRLQTGLATWLRVFRRAISAARYFLRLARSTPAACVPTSVDADVIVVTTLWKHRLEGQDNFRDVFLGDLPDHCVSRGRKVLVFGQIDGATDGMAELCARKDARLRTFGNVATWRDALVAAVRAAVTRLPTARIRVDPIGDVTALARADLAASRGIQVAAGLFLERCLGRLLRANPRADLLHIYENNSWEFACQRTARALGRRSVGYQHCAVLPSHLKMRRPRHWPVRIPGPDRIVASGLAARDLLLGIGHDPKRVIAGCGLRISDAIDAPPRVERPQRARRFLVLLQGSRNQASFLNFLIKSFPPQDGLEVQLRSHPAIPLASLIEGSALVLDGRPFAPCTSASLFDAVREADVVIYNGTTAALETVCLGTPVIFVETGEPYLADALFASNALKGRVDAPEQMLPAAEGLVSLSDADYERELAQARQFFSNYFAKPTPDLMDRFIQALDMSDP